MPASRATACADKATAPPRRVSRGWTPAISNDSSSLTPTAGVPISQMSHIAGKLKTRERRAVAAWYAGLTAPRRAERAASRHGAARSTTPGTRRAACPHARRATTRTGRASARPPPTSPRSPPATSLAQIERWRHASRRTDSGDVMLRISQLLTPSEAAARGLRRCPSRGPPGRESPAAFRATRHDDSRSGASGPPLHVPESARAGAR